MADPRLPAEQAFNARDPLITVRIGGSQATFDVHESILCSSSNHFKNVRKPNWSESKVRAELWGTSEEEFNLYVNWLYKKKIPTATATSEDDEKHAAEWKTLTASYALGDYIDDTSFMDCVVDAMQAKVRSASGHTVWSCGSALVNKIYLDILERPALKKFIVDVYASHAGQKELASVFKHTPKEFIYDVLVATKKSAKPQALKKFHAVDGCKYHSHGVTGGCHVKQTGSSETMRASSRPYLQLSSRVRSPSPGAASRVSSSVHGPFSDSDYYNL